MTPPHLAIDVRMLRHAGIGRYVSQVVPRVIAARPDWRVTLLTPSDPGAAAQWNARDVVRCSSDIYSVAEQLELPRRTPSRLSAFWSPHYNIPLLNSAPLVTTIHDVAHLVLESCHPEERSDEGSLRHAKRSFASLRMTEVRTTATSAARRFYARQMLSRVRSRSRVIFFNSAFTRAEFTRVVSAPRASEITHLAVDDGWPALARDERPHDKPYLLFVGSVKPHKNLLRLLQAYEAIVEAVDHDLVLAGSWRGQRTVDTPALELAAKLGARVRLVEAPDDATLATFMRHAAALVLPSLYEGFGLPALEAMSVGCPCIVSNAASLPEVCGDAAVYVHPMDRDDVARQIQSVLSDEALRRRLIARGQERVKDFNWSTTAERSAEAIERVMYEAE